MKILPFLKKHFLLCLVLLVSFLIFIFLSYSNNFRLLLRSYEQNIVSYAKSKIKSFHDQNPNTQITFKKININIDGLTFKDLKITTKSVQKIYIPHLNLDLDWWRLVFLKINFKLTISEIDAQIIIKKNLITKTKTKDLHKAPQVALTTVRNILKKIEKNKIFLNLFNLSLSHLSILKGQLSIINKNNILIRVENFILNSSLKKNLMQINFFSNSIKVKNALFEKNNLSLHAKVTATKNKNTAIWAKLRHKQSSVMFKANKIATELQINTPLKEIAKMLESSKKNKQNSKLRGTLSLNLSAKKLNTSIDFSSKLNNFYSSNFYIGNLKLNGSLHPKKIQIDKITLNSPAWTVQSNGFSLKKTENYLLSFNAVIKKFQLKHLIKNTNTNLFANGLTQCTGKFYPFHLSCKVSKLNIKNLTVLLNKNRNILKIDSLKGNAKVLINTNAIKFQTTVFDSNNLKNTAKASGNITYNSKFIIDYNAFLTNISFLKLFNMQLAGTGHVKGLVQLNKGVLLSKNNAQLKKFRLKKIFLGSLNFKTTYSNDQFFVQNIILRNKSEKIKGALEFLFKKNTLFTNLEGENINLSKIQSVFGLKSNHVSGLIKSIQSKILWNLDFKPLSLKTTVQVNNLLINKLYFPLTKIYLNKNIINDFTNLTLSTLKNNLNVYGRIFQDSSVVVNLNAKKMLLENLFYFSKSTIPIKSLFDLKAKIQGPLTNMRAVVDINFYKTYINKILQKNSKALIKYNYKTLTVIADFFNNTLKTDFVWNIASKSFQKWNLDIVNWDYSPLISFYSKIKTLYTSKLSAHLNLIRTKNGKYSGSLDIPKFSLYYDQHGLSNKNNILITLRKNHLTIKNFFLTGNSGYIDIKQSALSNIKKINLTLNSKLKLSLLNQFLSHSSIQSGNLEINNLKFTKNLFAPNLNGKIQLQNLIVKNQDTAIVPSVTNSLIKLSIKNSKMHLNKFTLNLEKNSKAKAHGFFLLKKPFSSNIEGEILQLNLKKNGLNTTGNFRFKMLGEASAYILKATYKITTGKFLKKVLNWKNKNLEIDTKFLPKKLSKNPASFFNPMLDLKITTQSPVKTEFTVGNMTLNTQVMGNLELQGPINRPLVNGKIYSSTGEIKIQKQIIVIDNIKVQYDDNLFSQSNLSLFAHSEVNNISIKIKARGKLDNIKFFLSSNPPLPENKIAFLLVFGSLPKESNSEWRDISKSTSYSILSSLLRDYLKIKENLDVNLALTSTSNENRSETSSAGNIKLRGTRPVLNLEKAITKKLKFKATTEFDEQSQNTFLLEYQINPHLSVKSSISDDNNLDNLNKKKNIEFGLEYDIEFE